MEWWSSHEDQAWRDLSHPDGLVMFMRGVWWRPRFLSKKMKAVSDKKKQEHLAGHTGPSPVDVLIQSKKTGESEDFQFFPAAVGSDTQSAVHLRQARASPFDDQDDDSNSGGSDEDEDED